MKKLFFICAVAALAFAACSKDGADSGPDGSDPFDGEKAWFSLNVSGATLTRAYSNIVTGSTAENALKTVRVLLFDDALSPTTAKVVYDKTFTVGGAEVPAAGTAGAAFQVPGTSKALFLVANEGGNDLPAEWDGVAGNAFTFATFNAALDGDWDELMGGTSNANGFLMTSSRGTLEPVTIHKTEAAANAAPSKINIDRVVAKVRFAANTSTNTTNVSISDVSWVLNVTNKKFFPASERVASFVGTTMGTEGYGLGWYRKDPNYAHTGDLLDPTTATYKANYDAYYNATGVPTLDWITAKAVGSVTDADWVYCMENTQQKDDNMYAFTTQALIRAKYSPTAFYIPGNTTTPTGTPHSDNSGDWLRLITGTGQSLQQTFYTTETIVLWIEAELTARYKSFNNESSIATPITDAYNAYLTAISAGAVTVPPTASAQTDTQAEADAASTAADFAAKAGAVKTAGAGTRGRITYYAGGVNYYQVMIKHDNNTNTGDNELGEFGVVRNSQYDIRVSRFDSPGLPTVPDPDPDIPDEDAFGWLAVEINVNPWMWFIQEEIL